MGTILSTFSSGALSIMPIRMPTPALAPTSTANRQRTKQVFKNVRKDVYKRQVLVIHLPKQLDHHNCRNLKYETDLLLAENYVKMCIRDRQYGRPASGGRARVCLFSRSGPADRDAGFDHG